MKFITMPVAEKPYLCDAGDKSTSTYSTSSISKGKLKLSKITLEWKERIPLIKNTI